jgi:hypothetical protein
LQNWVEHLLLLLLGGAAACCAAAAAVERAWQVLLEAVEL